MILPDFILTTRQNKIWSESGMDSLRECFNKKHFKNYPYQISYNYNSRGFRDEEWPQSIEELRQAVWCFGDSFTVGIGSPINHTWVNILQSKLNRRCINVSMDGASNQWITRKVLRVLEEIKPKEVCIQWSFLHRDESLDDSLSDECRRLFFNINNLTQDLDDKFNQLFNSIEYAKNTVNLYYSKIPNSGIYSKQDKLNQKIIYKWNNLKGSDWPGIDFFSDSDKLSKNIHEELRQFNFDYFELYKKWSSYNCFDKIMPVTQIDYARDYFHYDKLTAERFVNDLVDLIVTKTAI